MKTHNSELNVPNSTVFFLQNFWSFSSERMSPFPFWASKQIANAWYGEKGNLKSMLKTSSRYHGNLRVSNFTPFPTKLRSSYGLHMGPFRFPLKKDLPLPRDYNHPTIQLGATRKRSSEAEKRRCFCTFPTRPNCRKTSFFRWARKIIYVISPPRSWLKDAVICETKNSSWWWFMIAILGGKGLNG